MCTYTPVHAVYTSILCTLYILYTVVGKSLSDSGAFKIRSGEESSSSGCFNPVGRLQQSGCLWSYPPYIGFGLPVKTLLVSLLPLLGQTKGGPQSERIFPTTAGNVAV